MNDVFLDTSYAIALSSPKDAHHAKAVVLAQQLEDAGTQIVTTVGVVLEIGNALSRLRYRKAAVALLSALESDAKIEVVSASEELCGQAFELFQQRMDKEWGMTDCLSFVVMSEREITAALTADDHFRQAGFQALLLES